MFGKCYPEFKRVVCYNHMEWPIDLNFDVPLYQQQVSDFAYPLTPRDGVNRYGGTPASGWKLCPPRLNPEGPELFLDNDIVIHNRMPSIDRWLEEGGGIISEGLHRIFGIFERYVPKGVQACAGFFGVPKGFDLERQALDYCRLLKLCNLTLGDYDEQGLVAAVITNMDKFSVVPLTEVAICENWHKVCPSPLPPAIHFVGANRKEYHGPWCDFLSRL